MIGLDGDCPPSNDVAKREAPGTGNARGQLQCHEAIFSSVAILVVSPDIMHGVRGRQRAPGNLFTKDIRN
jgi:hypothetical protein